MVKKIVCLIVLEQFVFVFSQEKLIDTVFVLNKRLKDAELSQEVIKIPNDIERQHATNLSEVLRFQTPFYIKENGRGMVSSPSFRGSTAQQTAFVWNGININSIFLGQGDINNLGLLHFDNISIKTGGGSIAYGSGAIGGSVHLDDKITLSNGLKGNLFSEYGSFNTLNSSAKLSYSDQHFFVKLNMALAKSDNDYEVPTEQYINRNGKYYQYNYALSGGYRFDNKQKIAIFSLWNTGLQHYPIFSETQTRTKYATNGMKTMLNWESQYKYFDNDLKLVFLRESYDYYSDIQQPKSNGAVGDTWLLRNDVSYRQENDFSLNLITEYQYSKAIGYASGIKNPSRHIGNISLLVKKKLNDAIKVEAAVRKDIVDAMNSPFLYAVGAKAEISKHYSIKINGSKNFRLPTFNDLYWQPGGNLDLTPEIAYQLEIGHHLKGKKFGFSLVPYYHYVENLIQWRPTSVGYWSPFNTRKVRSLGAEVYSELMLPINQAYFQFKVSYAYNHSMNLETKQNLSYIPKYKSVGEIAFKHKKVEAYVQGLFTSAVYTTEDESKDYRLPKHWVMNAGVSVPIMKYFRIGGKVANILNEIYATSRHYPLPLRNYSIHFNINF